MLIPFNKMPDYARVWVYQANRDLTDSEVNTIQQILESQINNWAAHGSRNDHRLIVCRVSVNH